MKKPNMKRPAPFPQKRSVVAEDEKKYGKKKPWDKEEDKQRQQIIKNEMLN